MSNFKNANPLILLVNNFHEFDSLNDVMVLYKKKNRIVRGIVYELSNKKVSQRYNILKDTIFKTELARDTINDEWSSDTDQNIKQNCHLTLKIDGKFETIIWSNPNDIIYGLYNNIIEVFDEFDLDIYKYDKTQKNEDDRHICLNCDSIRRFEKQLCSTCEAGVILIDRILLMNINQCILGQRVLFKRLDFWVYGKIVHISEDSTSIKIDENIIIIVKWINGKPNRNVFIL